MPFDQSDIVDPRATRDDASLVVSWGSTAPAGTTYQVYVDGLLAWSGRELRAVLPYPGNARAVPIDVGAVAAGEAGTNFAADLPAPPGGGSRARLTWQGGATLAGVPDGYRIYMGTAPGGAVDYDTVIASVPAYTAGVLTTTFGDGSFGGGSFGYPGAAYSWTSRALAGGVWNFGVVAHSDAMGESTPEEVAVVIEAPPGPPAADADGKRLTADYSATTGVATLNWLASEG